MADDDQGEKSEDPTDQRRREARNQGNVAKSVDVNAAAIMLAATGGLMFLGPDIAKGFAGLLRRYLEGPPVLELDRFMVMREFWNIFQDVAGFALPFMLLMLLTAVVANLAQIGVLFTTEPLGFKWQRINPVSGFQRIFSVAAFAKFGTSVGKIVAMAGVACWFLYLKLPALQGMGQSEPSVILGTIGSVILELAFQLALAMLIIALLDYSFQKWKHEQDLKMSKQEIRDEMKNMDGDPHIRQRRKEAHRKLAEAKELNAVRDADVVLTNPTHLSVALKYDSTKHPAPVVVAKGAGEIAMRIREIARENNVPIIERKPLARALYRDVKVGHPIPAEMYEVFVEIMAYVYRLTGKSLPK
ncbi:flagellar biosynthesis protein FlhB [Rubinisphaera sp. JC750]|uniref:flagellar biosynthesis protein FlhB n=1 Tax=Rubinisphaera sp. JC750 TaxID=2898658 RepID=UPI001F02A45E|nr:flagellar biosynthesis protein FlhB [Rubinisphaera sp. JC750]